MATPIILKENATHKAVKENGQIGIWLKGFDFEDIHESDQFLYEISESDEDDLFAIFERYDEDNRINMAEFQN
jgi:hypothetical protein